MPSEISEAVHYGRQIVLPDANERQKTFRRIVINLPTGEIGNGSVGALREAENALREYVESLGPAGPATREYHEAIDLEASLAKLQTFQELIQEPNDMYPLDMIIDLRREAFKEFRDSVAALSKPPVGSPPR